MTPRFKPGMLVRLFKEACYGHQFYYREIGARRGGAPRRCAACGDIVLVLEDRIDQYPERVVYTILIDGVKAAFAECFLRPFSGTEE